MMNQQQKDDLSQMSHCAEEVEQHVVQLSDQKELVVY